MVCPLNGLPSEIESAFVEVGLQELPAASFRQFQAYLDLLVRWNQRLNLTAVRHPEQIIRRHFVESAFAARHLPTGIVSLLDYGSGAGFPGIPIAICRPEIHVTLAEAHAKKASFLREVLRVLELSSEVYAGRVESMDQQFDAVSMRAVEKMELAVPVAVGHLRQYLVLLTTAGTVTRYQKLAQNLQWQEPLVIPNTEQMVLAVGRCLT